MPEKTGRTFWDFASERTAFECILMIMALAAIFEFIARVFGPGVCK